jgi:hypothetical protein
MLEWTKVLAKELRKTYLPLHVVHSTTPYSMAPISITVRICRRHPCPPCCFFMARRSATPAAIARPTSRHQILFTLFNHHRVKPQPTINMRPCTALVRHLLGPSLSHLIDVLGEREGSLWWRGRRLCAYVRCNMMFASICRSPAHLARISGWLTSLGVVLLLVVDWAGM